jgi:mortality factor 4-like protein 1
VPLPRTPNVKTLLAEYKADVLASVASSAKARAGESPKALAILDEVLEGLYVYFNKSLGSNLLYRFERQQYLERRREWQAGEEAKKGGEFVAGEVYGAEHLLRLFGASGSTQTRQAFVLA